MDPEHLKNTFGDRLTFWGGGCDTRRMLTEGTLEEDIPLLAVELARRF